MIFFTRRGKTGELVRYVDYLESTGTQYIDTGFLANQNTRVVIDFEYLSGDVIFGAYNTSGAGGFGLQAASGKFYFYYGSGSGYTSTAISANVRYLADCNKNVVSLDKTAIHTAAANTFQGENPLLLFGIQNAGNPGFYTSLKLYSCQIYQSGSLVRDFRPCYDPDGVACLYDKVTKEYYYNQGAGAFIAAGDEPEEPEIAVGTTWTFLEDGSFTAPVTGSYQIELHGGGGGGGGICTDTSIGLGYLGQSGGGSGNLQTVELSEGVAYQVSIGQGGAHGDDTTDTTWSGHGADGGTTSFGSYSVAGGYGGFGGCYIGYDPIKNPYSGSGVGNLASSGSSTDSSVGYGNKNNTAQAYGNGGQRSSDWGARNGQPGAVIVTYLG